MSIQRINPSKLQTPLAAYSQVVKKGPIITTAGLIPTNTDGSIVGEGDIKKQTTQTLENLVIALAAVGATLDDVVKTTIYLSNLENFKEMNEVYNKYFEKNPPARATIGAQLVLPSLLFEIDAIAIVD
tara:strand:- start:239 stop:622 length:384 start_codon:yes stop_codon:yes gene_type:complete